MTNLFWYLPAWMKKLFQPKGKTSLTIHPFKAKEGWVFNMLPITWHEQLVFSDLLDDLAGGKDHLTLNITTYPVEGSEHLWFEADDALDMEHSVYVWGTKTVWLCGWLQWYFGHKPSDLCFTVKS